jgi:SAM-dependent methyltransferase
LQYHTHPLHLNHSEFSDLFQNLGPSLGLWRGAEIAALREQTFEPPVLDLGCGDGFVMARVLEQVDIGIDPDQHALERAAHLGLYRRLEAVAVEDSNLPAGSVGTIISNSVLEHIPQIDSALAAASRLLRPGGRLVFTTPTHAFSKWLALPGSGYAARRNRHFLHHNLWPAEEWARRLALAGLDTECVRPYLRAGLVRAWDAIELLQIPKAGRRRLFGLVWRKLPPAWIDSLARRAARIDLSAPAPGGGQLITTRKR